jgi:glutamate--cysteine ligase regulatory subunit
MTAAHDILRHGPMSKSSTELITSLRSHIRSSPLSPPPSPSLSTPNNTPIYIPTPPTPEPLAEERSEYDVTVKLFHLPAAAADDYEAHAQDAVKRVLSALGISKIDLLILSLPGISFDAEDSAALGCDPEEVARWAQTYSALETMLDDGVIGRLGISEFGSARLAAFLPHTRIKPSVIQINVRDCCVVPKPLILMAKREGIDLLTHNDCNDILPSESLEHVLVDEFGVLEKGREITPLWVVKYTAVIRSRGVVENKGYVFPFLSITQTCLLTRSTQIHCNGGDSVARHNDTRILLCFAYEITPFV